MYHCHILTHEEAGMMGQFTVVGETVSVDGFDVNPNTFSLLSAYPNPFNPRTTIQFSVETERAVSLNIYDISGQWVESLVEKQMEPGIHKIQWNAQNLPSGVYIVSMQSGNQNKTKKLILLK
jgi:flagellar hook assembly protein FlgD